MTDRLTDHHARIVWEPNKRDPRAHRVTAGGETFEGSSSAHWGGDPGKADPEELFVAALSACHMLWFLELARGERLRVRAYEDDAEGTMDGVRFTHVALRPRIEWEGEPPPAELVADLHARAHGRCFIANSVSCPVDVEAPVAAA